MKQLRIILNGKKLPKISMIIEDILLEEDKVSLEVNAKKYLNDMSWQEEGCPERYAIGWLKFDKPYTATIKGKEVYINGHCTGSRWGPITSKRELPKNVNEFYKNKENLVFSNSDLPKLFK